MKQINLSDAKIAFQLGLWNGKDPAKSITREEAAAIQIRAIKKLLSGEITTEKMNELTK